MGFFDSLSDIVTAATPWSMVEAEAPTKGGAGTETTPANKDTDKEEGESEVCEAFSLDSVYWDFEI